MALGTRDTRAPLWRMITALAMLYGAFAVAIVAVVMAAKVAAGD